LGVSFLHWGDVPTWITAVVAAAALSAAIRAYGKQNDAYGQQVEQVELQRQQLDDQRKINVEQTKVLKLQLDELADSLADRKREADERRRDQAYRIYTWEERATSYLEGGTEPSNVVSINVRNTSDQPIYEVNFSWRINTSSGTVLAEQTIRTKPLMPGQDHYDTVPVPDGVASTDFGAVVTFRDRAGLWWRARPDGTLDELKLGEEPPHSW
jgi:hypothetical protein